MKVCVVISILTAIISKQVIKALSRYPVGVWLNVRQSAEGAVVVARVFRDGKTSSICGRHADRQTKLQQESNQLSTQLHAKVAAAHAYDAFDGEALAPLVGWTQQQEPVPAWSDGLLTKATWRALLRPGPPQMNYAIVFIKVSPLHPYHFRRCQMVGMAQRRLHPDGRGRALMRQERPAAAGYHPTEVRACIQILDTSHLSDHTWTGPHL
jgi:hypothetical protein